MLFIVPKLSIHKALELVWIKLKDHFHLKESAGLRRPLIADSSIDVVVSNCVLNLVDARDRRQLFAEIFRVLKTGGRAVISDIVSDEEVLAELRDDPELWSGCISGAFVEDEFLKEFERAGFYGVEIVVRQEEHLSSLAQIIRLARAVLRLRVCFYRTPHPQQITGHNFFNIGFAVSAAQQSCNQIRVGRNIF